MIPNAFITHSMRGRSRIQIPSARGNAAYFENLRRQLERVEGVDSLQTNPVTGSMLVLHREGVAGLLDEAARQNLFVITAEKPLKPITGRLGDRLAAADSSLRRATGGNLDLPGAIALGFTGAGVLQLMRGAVLPQATTLFWYAFGLAWVSRSRDK